MDTSKEYIKMCDCPEIQDIWESVVGDFYFTRDGLFRPMNIVDVYDGKGYAVLPRDANYGWLPRQDQIQEMLEKEYTELFRTYYSIYGLFHFFSIFYDRPDTLNKHETGEQLWLAFYMSEKHQKFWGKNGWEKSGQTSKEII